MHRFIFVFLLFFFFLHTMAGAQGARQGNGQNPDPRSDRDHMQRRAAWFYRGRIMQGSTSAELRKRAYQRKLQMRAERAAALTAVPHVQLPLSSGSWMPLGPAPLASDASGNGTQDYRQVAGRAVAVAIDAADPSGNTIYIGGAQAGVWKSTNAADPTPNNVTWTPLTDNQATLSIGAIAIQPGTDPTKSVILAATGEADSSADSYFGLGILRSTDGGNTWSLISNANNGALSFNGLGGTRMAFSSANPNSVVAAMATTSEGVVAGAVTSGTVRGLYTSLDAGISWNHDGISENGMVMDATSATSVVYNASARLFFAAIRYHGFYSSPDGMTWTRLTNQPGGAVLSTVACPPQSTANNRGCPIYRGEITVVPGRNEMYVWYVSFAADGEVIDGGIWQSLNGGTSWNPISGSGITNCGDVAGCGVEQGYYNLALLALPSGQATDLYAGAVNIYKCSITTANPTCSAVPFMNLTHAYGCVPAGAPAHVHPDQHAVAGMIPTIGGDSGNALLYFATDGGIYRALNGYSGLNSGSCSGLNQFDDLNQNLGSMTQFVSFSQHPTDANILLGGAQDNGSPATDQATTNSSWISVLGGDGGYNAIDALAPSNWYASNPDVPPGGLGIQLCSAGFSCNNSGFNFVVTSNTLGGDDGAFYFPYVLDPYSASAMLVGTCRVWRGPKIGGAFVALSPNFETLGSGPCSGSEVNQVTALATGGLTDSVGSSVIYATTSGLGPLNGPLTSPSGGRVWVTTDALSGIAAFTEVTGNGPQGSINPKQFPISGVAIDSRDASGNTAYVTVMGFTGGGGHVWKTTNAGLTWTDFTANLPDSPVNAIVIYPPMSQVFVATDVGVFGSPTSAANWTELGPNPSTNQAGFLPNVAVTALGVFASGGQQLLRASTYGRGMWQFNLVITPDFQVAVANPQQTVFGERTATFNGTVTAVNGYTSSVALSCGAMGTSAPSACSPTPGGFTPASKTPFTVAAGGAIGDYNFNVQVTGSDASHVTHKVPLTLHIVNFAMTTPTPSTVTVGRGATSQPVGFQITAAGSFSQNVSVSCTTSIPSAICSLTPAPNVNPTASAPVSMSASVDVPSGTAPGNYLVTLQASTVGAPSPVTGSFTLTVTANPDFILSEPTAFPVVNAGSSGTTGSISVAAQDGFAGTVALSCPTTFGAGSCSISPVSVSTFPATATLTINGTSFTAGAYSLSISGASGSLLHTLAVPFNVGDYSIMGNENLAGAPGSQVSANFQLSSSYSYSGKINATCDATALAGAICSLTPANPLTLSSGATANLAMNLSVPRDAIPGSYEVKINTGDTTGAPLHGVTVTITLAPDFHVTSSTASQTVKAGQQSGPYNLWIRPVGASFDAPVTLACAGGLPAGAQCLFNPSSAQTPGSSGVQVIMTIATQGSRARLAWPSELYAIGFMAPAIVLGWPVSLRQMRRRQICRVVLQCLALLLILLLASCSGVSNAEGGGGGTPPPNPVTYQVTVRGTSVGSIANAGQSTVVTLVVD